MMQICQNINAVYPNSEASVTYASIGTVLLLWRIFAFQVLGFHKMVKLSASDGKFLSKDWYFYFKNIISIFSIQSVQEKKQPEMAEMEIAICETSC